LRTRDWTRTPRGWQGATLGRALLTLPRRQPGDPRVACCLEEVSDRRVIARYKRAYVLQLVDIRIQPSDDGWAIGEADIARHNGISRRHPCRVAQAASAQPALLASVCISALAASSGR